MKYIKKVLGEDLRQYTMIVALAALIIIFNIASGGKMVTSSNFQNLISGNAYVLVLALGMLMVIVIGQIDLSVGSVAGFASTGGEKSSLFTKSISPHNCLSATLSKSSM